MAKKIPSYIYEKSKVNGFDFYRYLHIRGGSGNIRYPEIEEHRYGGEYHFILYYARPEELEGIGPMCERLWCREKGIVYGEGDSIDEAYQNYQEKAPQIKGAA